MQAEEQKENAEMGILSNLEPKSVWKYFEDICKIPHGSGNEKAVSDYCVAFAREHGLEVWQDEAWNVVIVKEASAGYEDREPLILQGHLDMVCEKKPDCDIDFEKDGLRLVVDGDYVCADGTTLGGDDGIAIAYALAVLSDESLPHPRLEAVFTTSEEVGMDGAAALDVSMLKGHTVLNMDSEEEGILLAGCAGGCSVGISLLAEHKKKSGIHAVLTVEGLLGGHSGAEINRGRGNANRLLAAVLADLVKETECALISINGGQKDNAIPRECHADLLFPEELSEAARQKAVQCCAACGERLKQEYGAADPDLSVQLQFRDRTEADVFSESSYEHAMALLTSLPNGVICMSRDIEGLVQTSLNLGVVKTDEEKLVLRYSVRSSVLSEKEALVEQIRQSVYQEGGSMTVNGDYPAWEYRRDSPFRDDCVRIYRELFGTEPKVEAIHAGLECGLLASKIPDLDCISMGPQMHDIHTTEERLSVSSVERMWRYILKIIQR